MVLENLGKKLDQIMRKILRLPTIDKDAINALIKDLQSALLNSDVKVELVLEMTENIKKEAMNTDLKRGRRNQFIIKLIHDELITILGGQPAPIRIKPGKKNVILLVGIQGSGKTTTVGKLAKYYKSKGLKVAAITTDTWRPGAYEQLQQLTQQIGVECFGNSNEKNAVRIAVKQTKKALNQGFDLLIVDTAGRHKEEKELMEEMQKIERALKPNEVMLVIDGTLGQQAYSQAKVFSKTTNLGSIIVTKLDGTAKGGGALSACAATNASIRFIGTGEKIEDLEPFNPTDFVGTLLGIPNIQGLIEQFKKSVEDPTIGKRGTPKIGYTLEDLYKDLKAIGRVGKFRNIISMMGGGNIPEALKEDAEKNIERWHIVLDSMTSLEKQNPKIIKKSRKKRISIGSGTSYSTINRMLNQYNQMKKMRKKFLQLRKKGKGMGAMPGMKKQMAQMMSRLGKNVKF